MSFYHTCKAMCRGTIVRGDLWAAYHCRIAQSCGCAPSVLRERGHLRVLGVVVNPVATWLYLPLRHV